MSEVAYDSHLPHQEDLAAASPADERPNPADVGPARMVTYPYVGALERRECERASKAADSLADLEHLVPKDHMEGVLRGNRIYKQTMAFEHNAQAWLREGNSLFRNLRYQEARSRYLSGLCYADRFPELRAELVKKLKETEEKLAGR